MVSYIPRPVMAIFFTGKHRYNDFSKKVYTDYLQMTRDAKKFLSENSKGFVEVRYADRDRYLTTYYSDYFTKNFIDVVFHKFSIGHSSKHYIYSYADTITMARIKACIIMEKENYGDLNIYDVTKNNKITRIGRIIKRKNGYEYSVDDEMSEDSIRYTLNPLNGRIKQIQR